MWREKPLWQESELRTQRQHLPCSRKIWEVLKEEDWHPGSPENSWRDTGCDRSHFERFCKFRRWGGSGWWWRYRAGQAEGQWWTRLGDGHNLENGTAAHREISAEADEAWRIDTTRMGGQARLFLWQRFRSTAQPNWRFLQSSNHIRTATQQILHPQHLESLWSLMTSSPENCKCCSGLLDQEVVIWGEVLRDRSRINAYCHFHPKWSPIHHLLQKRSLLNP